MSRLDKAAIVALGAVMAAAAVACGPPGDAGGFGSPAPGSDNGRGAANTNSSAASSGGGSSTGGAGASHATGTSSGGTSSTGTAAGSGSSGRGSGSQTATGSTTANGGASTSTSPSGGSNAVSQPAVPGVQTTTFSTVQIPVAAGAELVKCQNFQNPIGKDAAIIESDSTMANSHHMFVFHDPSFNQNDNAVSDCSGIEFHDLIHMAQTPQQTFSYPTGVGRVLSANEGLRVLVHLLNPATSDVTAQVTMTLKTLAPNAVSRHAVAIFLNQLFLTVPPGMSDSPDSFTIPSDALLMSDVSHMHSRAVGFNAVVNETGDVLYQTTQWSEPVPKTFSPNLLLHAGNTINWTCSYNNTTGMMLTFGESATQNEMCILVGVIYPTTAGVELGTSFESAIN